MNRQDLLRPSSDDATQHGEGPGDTKNTHKSVSHTSDTADNPPTAKTRLSKDFTPFWRDRIVEAGLILSMALYYVVGNANLGTERLFHVNPLFSLPFLLVFGGLCWYRLSFAVALLPLGLPYYMQQKTVFSHYSFSIAEIALAICVVIAVAQFLLLRDNWHYRLSWLELRDRLGPFALPIIIFLVAAAISVMIAYDHRVALRAFREEVFDPILYVMLAMFCLRTRQDVTRLLLAIVGSGLVVAMLGMAQYFLFKSQLVRVHAMYGSANSIGLFFDYVLPIGLALILVKMRTASGIFGSWWVRIGAIAICMPLLLVLYLSQSLGALIAIFVAALFIIALRFSNRKVIFLGGLIIVIALSAVLLVFHKPITAILFEHHASVAGVGTLTKRLYLWQSAWKMIYDHLWFGVGMENWLCYYSYNSVCFDPAMIHHYYLISRDPVTHALTGLRDEPTLSHPHNIFLHVWVSMGVFGLLAFIAVLVLFFWLFARILIFLRSAKTEHEPYLWWMTVSVGAAMLAALIQGQVDSSFLVQDLAFCFWMLVTALLLLRTLTGTPWQGNLQQRRDTSAEDGSPRAQAVAGQ